MPSRCFMFLIGYIFEENHKSRHIGTCRVGRVKSCFCYWSEMATLPPPIHIIAFGNVAESGLHRLLRFQKRWFFINYPRNNASIFTILIHNDGILTIQNHAFYRHIYRLKILVYYDHIIAKNIISFLTLLSKSYEKTTFHTILKPYKSAQTILKPLRETVLKPFWHETAPLTLMSKVLQI